MKISAKGRYALAAMVDLGQHYLQKDYITVISISERLGISKIYLEQVFSQLKKSGLLLSVKGAQGGYRLANDPKIITVYEILSAVELGLFEKTEQAVPDANKHIEKALQSAVFTPLDHAIETLLMRISLEKLMDEAEHHKSDDNFMFFI